ncbi:MAG TPA: FHA domain-containing protein [Solirubrobacteraceae bacterium]|nr:FHA domain-containing protein [Solirubrobacteraceae bacterium]
MATRATDHWDLLAPHSLSAAELKQLIEAERGGVPFLAYRDGLESLKLFLLPASERPSMVGRRSGMDLVIDWDTQVSGVHAQLQRFGGEVTIVDDGLSTNGTYVNGKRVVGRARLRDRDRIRIGRTAFVYRSAAWSPVQATSAAIDVPSAVGLTETQRKILIALCRPLVAGATVVMPATNQEIASEVHLGVDAVKAHLRKLFTKFKLADLPQNQKRAKLAEYALHQGLVTPHDVA